MQTCMRHKGAGIMNANKQKKQISIWTMLRRLFPQIFKVSPGLFILYFSLFVLDGAFFPLSVYAMQLCFDKIASFTINKKNLFPIILALMLLFGLKILEQILNGIAYYIAEAYDPKATARLTYIVNEKMGRLNPICFESAETLDDINKSYAGIKYAINYINTIIDVIAVYVPQFIFMGVYLFSLKPLLSLSLFLVFIPVMISQAIRSKFYSSLEDKSAPYRRKCKYYEDCLVSREYLKETRMLGSFSYFSKLYKDSIKIMNQLKWKADIKANLIELGAKLISLAGYMGILWMLFDALMKREISVGAFAAVFASIGSMFDLMEEMLCSRLGYYFENFGKIQNYLRFLDLPERQGADNIYAKNFNADITFEDVSFSYPSASKNALEHISLSIHKGETIALVGANGSGKSTFVRLLTGLYTPTSGKVLYTDKPTTDFSPKVMYSDISGVFQKFQRYQLSLADNIMISNMGKEAAQEVLNAAVAEAGLDVNSEIFPDGYNTMLSREFDGVDLSGGQWQRVAIARGFYKPHELIVLDEPTSAIDPVEEVRLYERFASMAKGKTAVIVTHRLGSVKFADRIVVMSKGKIVGTGTHNELLTVCPLYEEMWEAQAQYYTNT